MADDVGAPSAVPGYLAGTASGRRADLRVAMFAGVRPDSPVDAVARVWLCATIAELTQRLARPPSVEELATVLGGDPETLLEAMDLCFAHRSQSEHADEQRRHLLARLCGVPARERRSAVRFVYEANAWPSASPPTAIARGHDHDAL